MKLNKVNVFIDRARDNFFLSLLFSICDGLSSLFSTEPQKKICLIVRKAVSTTTFKIWSFNNDFRIKAEDGKVLSA